MMTISEFDQEIEDNLPTAAENDAFFNTRFQCRHIFTQGRRCGSPCLRGEFFCYHHHTTRVPVYNHRQRRARQSTALASGQPGPLELPMPEDHAAIGLAAGQILHAIAANTIDLRRAGMMLYALQIANCALPHQTAKPFPHNDMEEQAVDEIVHHPDLGIIAPETDLQEAEEYLTSGARRFDEMMRQMELDRMNNRIRELEARLRSYEPVTAAVDLSANSSALPTLSPEMAAPTPRSRVRHPVRLRVSRWVESKNRRVLCRASSSFPGRTRNKTPNRREQIRCPLHLLRPGGGQSTKTLLTERVTYTQSSPGSPPSSSSHRESAYARWGGRRR